MAGLSPWGLISTAKGESGISQSGLAAPCGVKQPSISALEKTLISKAPSKSLEPFVGKGLTLIDSEQESVTVNGIPVGNLKIYTASFCAAVIRPCDSKIDSRSKIDTTINFGCQTLKRRGSVSFGRSVPKASDDLCVSDSAIDFEDLSCGNHSSNHAPLSVVPAEAVAVCLGISFAS